MLGNGLVLFLGDKFTVAMKQNVIVLGTALVLLDPSQTEPRH